MIILTRDRVGELATDESHEAAYAEYEKALAAAPSLPASWIQLADLNLHDGLVESFSGQIGGTLTLIILHGDLQSGYKRTSIQSSDAFIDDEYSEHWEEAINNDETEILVSEVTRYANGFRLGLLFWPRGQLSICAKAVESTSAPESGRHFSPAPNRIDLKP